MGDLLNPLKNYFTHLQKLCLLWEGVPKRVSKTLNGIETLSQQLQSISRVSHDIRINRKFPHLKEHVIFKTLMALERELSSVIKVVQELEEATNKLTRLASSVDQHRDWTTSLSSESKSKLIVCAHDSRQYYQAQYSGLQISMKCLDFRESNTIRDLCTSLHEDKNLKNHVQFCILVGKHYIADLEDEQKLLLED